MSVFRISTSLSPNQGTLPLHTQGAASSTPPETMDKLPPPLTEEEDRELAEALHREMEEEEDKRAAMEQMIDDLPDFDEPMPWDNPDGELEEEPSDVEMQPQMEPPEELQLVDPWRFPESVPADEAIRHQRQERDEPEVAPVSSFEQPFYPKPALLNRKVPYSKCLERVNVAMAVPLIKFCKLS